MNRAETRPEAGFTLLEILISIVILALVLVSLFRLQSGTIVLTRSGQFKGGMPFVAERQLSMLMPEIAKGEAPSSGNISDGGRVYEWTCEVDTIGFETPIEISQDRSERLKKIHLEIMDTEKQQTYSITVWRYLVEPDK